MTKRLGWALALVGLASLGWLAWPGPEELPAPTRPRSASAPLPVRTQVAEPRRTAAGEFPATSMIGRRVQAAMAEPGDSDPRLLDALSALSVRPTDLAWLGAAIDPWIVVGLVDLERQRVRRCGPPCVEALLAVEAEVEELVEDEGAAEVLRRFRQRDLALLP